MAIIAYTEQWEYLRLPSYDFDVKMKEIGEDRWELMAIIPPRPAGWRLIDGVRETLMSDPVFYFKRRKEMA